MPTLLLNLQDRLPGPKLDEFLTAGWRPVGQQLYTCDFIRTEADELFGCVQIRMPLTEFKFKRKQRRLLRQNGELFRFEIGPATPITREMREVNRKYIAKNPDRSRTDLEFHAGYYPEKRFINTQQVLVYINERLVAFSYFDVGEKCLYSKTGIYDPDYRENSLGIYTMLLEVQWAIANGYEYYHPGYVSVDFPIFNYKLRLGPMEYRHCQTGQWATLTDNDPSVPLDPLHLQEAAMYRLVTSLRRAGIGSRLKEYPSFTARFYYPGHGGGLVDAPFVCQLDDGIPSGRRTLISYDHMAEEYTVFNPGLSSLTDIKLQPVGPTGVARYPRPVPMEIVHLATRSIDEIRDCCLAAADEAAT
ncbi:GNAT family N-acetyltransferase [Neolewinella antarctica]|uniref:Arginine-tRNA-protein transferase n=1 Tax=Neolewinella antarctica TaxID=442734 RepID=A0ABX0X5S4_9BACT|nr:GNAT family N-acetyltransferase [Neolewinella antarctica]NJC24550.1 arginine-tRNA-protein transferase [Neolewinella antarctica]